MQRYHTLNIDRFIRDSARWDDEVKELQQKLEEISELPAMGNSEVHSTDISDPTERLASRRLKILQEIERIERYKLIYSTAFNRIEETDRQLINGFYFPEGMISSYVRAIAKEKKVTERTVYSMKREAVEHFRIEVDTLDE